MGISFNSSVTSFADVAHDKLDFDTSDQAAHLAIRLIDNRWFQRLRRIAQTGNTKLVFTYAEHSRFGHCVGVAHLALKMLAQLENSEPSQVKSYRNAVTAAAVLHDLGHSAPGSHLAERVWSTEKYENNHEVLTRRIIEQDDELFELLEGTESGLVKKVCDILTKSPSVPAWTHEVLSGDGWNIDRGNWAIVDSAMCAVSYGRYNVEALIDGYALTKSGELVLKENRLDALTHFLMARDSMYRQVYQHRTLQAADLLICNIVTRLRELSASGKLEEVYCDPAMSSALESAKPFLELPLETVFEMTEPWWLYHVQRWCFCADPILSDLASRVRDRRLFKTIRLPENEQESKQLIAEVTEKATELGFDSRYYVNLVNNKDRHRKKAESAPRILLESGEIKDASKVEPFIAKLFSGDMTLRVWLAVPKRVKAALGINR